MEEYKNLVHSKFSVSFVWLLYLSFSDVNQMSYPYKYIKGIKLTIV